MSLSILMTTAHSNQRTNARTHRGVHRCYIVLLVRADVRACVVLCYARYWLLAFGFQRNFVYWLRQT